MDAIEHFFSDIWPEIQRQRPGTEISIVGANAPDSLARFGDLEGVEVVGEVPDLAPYYRRAQSVLPLGPYRYDAGFWEVGSPHPPLALEPDVLVSRVFQLSPPTRFGPAFSAELRGAAKTEVFLHANVTGLHTDEAGSRVESVHVATLGGNEFRLAARCTVLVASKSDP